MAGTASASVSAAVATKPYSIESAVQTEEVSDFLVANRFGIVYSRGASPQQQHQYHSTVVAVPEVDNLKSEVNLLKQELALERANRELLSTQLKQTIAMLTAQVQSENRVAQEDALVAEHRRMMERLREQRHATGTGNANGSNTGAAAAAAASSGLGVGGAASSAIPSNLQQHHSLSLNATPIQAYGGGGGGGLSRRGYDGGAGGADDGPYGGAFGNASGMVQTPNPRVPSAW